MIKLSGTSKSLIGDGKCTYLPRRIATKLIERNVKQILKRKKRENRISTSVHTE